MTHPTITCERFNEQLGDFLERAVSEPARAAMESHALDCEQCGPLLADLRRLRIDAANLPELTPSHDLWSGIAERIAAPVVALPGAHPASRRWSRPAYYGLAAAALIVVTATITHRFDGGPAGVSTGQAPAVRTAAVSPDSGASVDSGKAVAAPAAAVGGSASESSRPAVRRSAGSSATRLASNKPSAEQTYDREIARLLVVYNQRRPDLDSATVAIVKKNLKIIDDAIAQTKLALRRDPASQFLIESLNDAFDTKVQLLRKAAMLPSGT